MDLASSSFEGICGGFTVSLPLIMLFGSQELKARAVADVLVARKLIGLAGSDVTSLHCEAKETPDGEYYIVNGEKKWIMNGVFADYFTWPCVLVKE